MSVTPKLCVTKEEDMLRHEITGFGEDVIVMWASLTAQICIKTEMSLSELITAAAYVTGREKE